MQCNFHWVLDYVYATTFLSSLNSRQVLFDDPHDEKDSPILRVKPSFRVKSRHSNVNWALDRSQSPDKTPTQIYVVTETITDDMPQIMAVAKIRNPNAQMKETSENSSRSDSASDSASQSSSM
ncbi:hypothetical protein CVT25_011469 [Psilocybe cyanescens]|uniref:Uncharacterized protein n=1 Tax=Psilocybe cyanescens TaxID=93625 RepID=A0A409XAB6_PSICY|nr:hypothetical protein CVT25_011469 [Psilocybe cyanescens]